MQQPSQRNFALRLTVKTALPLLAVAIGLMGICGWLFHNPFLLQFFSRGATMKFNSALLIIFGGTGLLLMHYQYNRPAKIFFLLMTGLSAAILMEHLFDLNLFIDELFFNDPYTDPIKEIPGRTSLLTASYTLLTGVSLFLFIYQRQRSAQLLATGIFVLVYLSVAGHLFHISGFYHLGKFSGLAFHTALGLLFINAGTMVTSPEYGWVSFLYQRTAKKKVLVYFLVYLLGTAPMFAGIYAYAARQGALSAESGIVVLLLFIVLVGMPVIWFVLRLLNTLDTEAKLANQRLEIAMAASGLAVWDIDLQSGQLQSSGLFAAFFSGPQQSPTTMQELWARFHHDDRYRGQGAFEEAAVFGKLSLQVRVLNAKGKPLWLEFYGESRSDANGKPVRLLGTVMNISKRKELEALKDEFISAASHELKTPLTTLKGYVQLAHGRISEQHDEATSGMLEKAMAQINKMNRMIVNFLNVAKAGSGKLPLHKSAFELDELITEVVNDFYAGVKQPHVSIFRHCDVQVMADRDKIGQVVGSLLSNAVKYSLPGKPITITCGANGRRAFFNISDEGTGISEKDKEYLFDRFYRVDNADTQSIAGFGVGLYLSAEIIHMHGGQIGVESSLGKGSTFYFSLPIS